MNRRGVAELLLGLHACEEPATTPTEDDDEEVCTPSEALTESMTSCAAAFPACGGDPLGSWMVNDWCLPDSYTSASTYIDEYCPGEVWHTERTWGHTLSFREDHTLVFVTTRDATLDWDLPAGCLDAMGFADCVALADAWDVICSERPGGDCTCEQSIHLTVSGETTWSVCEGTLTIFEAPGTVTGTTYGTPVATTFPVGPYETEYCIEGGVMRLESDPHELGGLYDRN